MAHLQKQYNPSLATLQEKPSHSLNKAEAPGASRARIELHRDFIFEQLSFAIHRAGLAQGFAEIDDDAGMAYALKAVVEHVKLAVQSANDLRALKLASQVAANDTGCAL